MGCPIDVIGMHRFFDGKSSDFVENARQYTTMHNGGGIVFGGAITTQRLGMKRTAMLPPPVTDGPFAPYDDGTKGVNYIDRGGNL